MGLNIDAIDDVVYQQEIQKLISKYHLPNWCKTVEDVDRFYQHASDKWFKKTAVEIDFPPTMMMNVKIEPAENLMFAIENLDATAYEKAIVGQLSMNSRDLNKLQFVLALAIASPNVKLAKGRQIGSMVKSIQSFIKLTNDIESGSSTTAVVSKSEVQQLHVAINKLVCTIYYRKIIPIVAGLSDFLEKSDQRSIYWELFW